GEPGRRRGERGGRVGPRPRAAVRAHAGSPQGGSAQAPRPDGLRLHDGARHERRRRGRRRAGRGAGVRKRRAGRHRGPGAGSDRQPGGRAVAARCLPARAGEPPGGRGERAGPRRLGHVRAPDEGGGREPLARPRAPRGHPSGDRRDPGPPPRRFAGAALAGWKRSGPAVPDASRTGPAVPRRRSVRTALARRHRGRAEPGSRRSRVVDPFSAVQVVILAGVAVSLWIKHRQRRQILLVWIDAAASCGLEVMETGPPVRARTGPLEVRFDASGDRGQNTQLAVVVPGPPDFQQVRIRPEAAPAHPYEFLWVPEIEIGHARFDATFWIEGPARLVLALLDAR